ncbi:MULTISPECIES: Bor/Iss family lipoprotein [Francisella]|uniref:Bor protein n=1 Tax=Francisella salina TaxID=573569 RepID=A0ABM5MAL1_FRAST|nr:MULTISPECIES: Bor protein [Francisella]AEI36271.1 Bor protein precursor [Francisella salina]
MKKIITFTIYIILAGCATQTVNFEKPKQVLEKPTYYKKDTFLLGMGPSTDINASKICKGSNNIYKVDAEQTTSDLIIAWATFGIYTPRSIAIYCKK